MKFLDDARLYRDSNHKNIMKLLGFCIETFPYLLVLEHFPRGVLKSHLLKESQSLMLLDAKGANARSKMALDVAQGLQWMHANGFTHSDLAARNCVVGASGEVVIGDYGLGPEIYKKDYYWSSGVPIPIRWTAPESLECSQSSIKILKGTPEANVWSMGVVLWEICEMGKFPYGDLSDEQVLERVISDKNLNLPMPTITSLPFVGLRNQMARIITSCFDPLPQQRLTIDKLILLLSSSS
jgi:tyrosine kinase 2